MKLVLTKNYIEGIHHYPEATGREEFLKHPHRHIFHIECRFEVTGSNREIEIFNQQFKIDEYFSHLYGIPANFGAMSCEMIAEQIVQDFNKCQYVKITEDGEGGAVIYR
ncbi:MAG: hypothetical protein LBC84_09235 [Prevotellaceae bacterium]|nr:hypothetical protein [Prevotellaceae bacterium]